MHSHLLPKGGSKLLAILCAVNQKLEKASFTVDKVGPVVLGNMAARTKLNKSPTWNMHSLLDLKIFPQVKKKLN